MQLSVAEKADVRKLGRHDVRVFRVINRTRGPGKALNDLRGVTSDDGRTGGCPRRSHQMTPVSRTLLKAQNPISAQTAHLLTPLSSLISPPDSRVDTD